MAGGGRVEDDEPARALADDPVEGLEDRHLLRGGGDRVTPSSGGAFERINDQTWTVVQIYGQWRAQRLKKSCWLALNYPTRGDPLRHKKRAFFS